MHRIQLMPRKQPDNPEPTTSNRSSDHFLRINVLFSGIYTFLAALRSASILGSLDLKYLVKLNSFLAPVLRSSSRSRFVRCWRAKTDGWAASTFHSNCDGKGPTVVIIQVGSYTFGGYTDMSQSTLPHGRYDFISRNSFCYFVLMVNTCFVISFYYISISQSSNTTKRAFTSNRK